MRYSVIIPNYDNWPAISRVVRSVAAQAGDAEVIVVDSSDDGTTERLREAFPEVTVVGSPHRLLPGPARNLGASKASGDVFVFVDGDCLPAPDWLATLRAASPALERGIVCGSIDLDEPADQSQFMEYVIWKLAVTSKVRGGPYHFLISDNMMIRREDFFKAGGFGQRDRENDIQLDARRRRVGLGVTLVPAARVFHIHRRGWRFHLTKLHGIGVDTIPLLQELGTDYRVGRWIMALFPIVFLVRWVRITNRILRYRPEFLGRYLRLQPMLWVGLVVYQAGLWHGLIRALRVRLQGASVGVTH